MMLPLVALMMAAAPVSGTPPAHSVLAFNVLFDGADDGKSLDAIERAGADVVCLTELTPRFARAFEKRFSERYPHRVFESKKGTWGVGIASRYPLSAARVFAQKPHRIPAMEARVGFPERRAMLACLHLFPPVGKHRKSDGFLETMEKNAKLRKEQAQFLVARYAPEKGSVLLVGDLNEESSGQAVKTLEDAGFARACAVKDQRCGPTFPGATYFAPAIFEIDHVLGRGVTFESARVIREGGSDHFPVFATFRLPH